MHDPPIHTLRPRTYFALALLLAAFAGFWSWPALTSGSALGEFDRGCALYWRSHGMDAEHHWLGTMRFLTDLGGVAAMTILAIMGALWQTSLRRRLVGFAWLGIVAGGGLLNAAAKNAADRDRPDKDWRDAAVLEENKSYPSGHSMGAAVGYGMLAYALALQQRRRGVRLAMTSFLLALACAIGFSRIYLRAHWFSDVVAGLTLGHSWLCLCLGLLERERLRRSAAPRESSAG